MKTNKILITTGDPLGVGEELVYKALLKIKPDREKIIIAGKNIGLDYKTVEFDQKDNGAFCYNCLKYACELANRGEIKGIVTAPVSKEALYKSGYFYNGQTEILEKLLSDSKNEKAEMVFIAKDLRVMLLTRHLPLSEVKINEEMIFEKVLRLNQFLENKLKIKNPKIALCALNPHAGEGGLLGDEEIKIITPAIKKLNKKGVFALGPYSADGLFGKIGQRFIKNQNQEYDAVVAMYHDQGLCPIKALCFDKAVNTTIGLKIVRTSPPTGTAYDIKGKNIADPIGMISAIELLLKLI